MKILLFVNGGLGDAVSIIPVIRTIKKKYPASFLDIYSDKKYINDLFGSDHDISNIVNDDYMGIKYDYILCCFNVSVHSTKDLIRYKIKHRSTKILMGVQRNKYFVNLLKNIFFCTSLVNFENNIRYNNLSLLTYLNIDASDYVFDCFAKSKKLNLTESIHQNRYLVFNIGASSGLITPKRWPIDNWLSLIKLIPSTDIILVGDIGDINLLDNVVLPSNNVLNLVGKTSVLELMSLVKDAELSISGDSGFSHLTNAVGGRLLLLWGPSLFNYSRPLNFIDDKTTYIITKIPCAPCFGTANLNMERDALAKCAYSNACMTSITSEMVYNELVKLRIIESN